MALLPFASAPFTLAAGGAGVGSTISGGTTGSVLFVGASSQLQQDNANFFWDDTNNKLGIGVNSSIAGNLHVRATAAATVPMVIQGTTSQSANFLNVCETGTATPFAGIRSDKSYIIETAASGGIDTTNWRAADHVNYSAELKITRGAASSGQNIGVGSQLALEDLGNTAAPIGYIKYFSREFVQNRSDLEFWGQVGRVISCPFDGGIFCYTGSAFVIDDFSNVGGVFSIPSYEYYAPGGPAPGVRCTTFSIYTPTFNTSGGAGPVKESASLYIQSQPTITGSSAAYGTWPIWIDAGNSRFDGNLEQWGDSTVQPRQQHTVVPSWVVSTDASRTARVVHNVYDTAAREAMRMEASGSAAMLGFFGASAIVQPVNTVAIDNVLINLGLRASGGTANFALTVKPPTGTTGLAPLQFTSGTSLTSPAAGAIEFTTDDLFFTITTGTARKAFILDNGSRLTSGTVPVATTNGRLIDSVIQQASSQVLFTGSAGFNETDDGNSSTADTIDWTVSNKHKSTLTGNCTYTFTAPANKCNLLLKIIQGGAGSFTVTWPAAVKWPGGTIPTLSTAVGAIDIVSFYYDGTNYFGSASLAFA